MIHVLGEINQGAEVGGKARQLDRLINAGFSVPAGFVLDASSWTDPCWPTDLATALKTLTSERVIVRSSASAEDGLRESYAGMFQSQTVLRLGDVGNAVKMVCEHAERVAPGAAFAVIIQEWIKGDVSGVSFSQHPTKAFENCTVTDALAGGASQIVDGTENPARAYAWPDRCLIPKKYPLKKTALEELGTYIRQIAELFGTPVDIEWTYRHKQWFFLQTRPMTYLPSSNVVDATEGAFMHRYAEEEGLLLVRNELEDVLPSPSQASFDLLRYLFRAGGCYERASHALGMEYFSHQVDDYFVLIMGALYVDPRHVPTRIPPGIFRSFETSWHLQKELKNFPLAFYHASASEGPTSEDLFVLLEGLDSQGEAYAQAGLLARLALTHKTLPGFSIEAIWERRQIWLAQRSPMISSQDFELAIEGMTKVRQVWKKPSTVQDVYAILREDVKDELRPWLAAIRKAIVREQAPVELAFDHSLQINQNRTPVAAHDWRILRLGRSAQSIAPIFLWKHLWDVRGSGESDDSRQTSSVGVSEGVVESVCQILSHPTDRFEANTIIVLEALTPEWFCIFDRPFAGLVTEKGGLMSHGAIQCRERGIPAVFGYRHAKTVLVSGTRIHLDGKLGLIKRLAT